MVFDRTRMSETVRSVTFSVRGEPLILSLPPAGPAGCKSVFLIGLPKAGSTLLNSLVLPVAQAAGLVSFNLAGELRALGVGPEETPSTLNALFLPNGYVYGGFRGLVGGVALPNWASGRTVALVRDPRDMLVSLYFSIGYSHSPPGAGLGGKVLKEFQELRDSVRTSSLDDFVTDRSLRFLQIYDDMHEKLKGIKIRMYRYEDVIFDKKNWLFDMAEYLCLPLSDNVAETIVSRNDVRPTVEDRTQHVRRVTPGDHREKLKPATIAQLDDTFRRVLIEYGYSTGASPTS